MELFPALEHVPCPFIFSAPHMPNPWSIVESASPSQSQKRADQWWENLQATWQQHQLLGMIALGFLMIGGCTDRGEAGIFLGTARINLQMFVHVRSIYGIYR